MIKLLEDLNEQQREAVLYDQGALLVLAGAGSGKTRVITRKVAYLISEKKIKPGNILAVTFTNKAAREMKGRIQDLLGNIRVSWVGTFHANAARILRIELPNVGKSADFTILDSSDQLSVVKEAFEQLAIDEKEIPPKSVLNSISLAKNQLKTPDDFASEAYGRKAEIVAEVYKIYQDKLDRQNCMDFGDLIMKAVTILRNHQKIRDKYNELFHYLLIDEYQDVNHAQYVLARYLSERRQNICAVGDDDQSIYGFRGADVSILLRFEEDFPGAKIIKLEENYRSTGTILKAANEVAKHNRGRKEKKLWTRANDGEKLGSNACLDNRQEARYVVRQINKLHKDGHKFKDFAILYRTNAQSRSIEELLKQEGVPYDIVGGLRFYERAEIKDILAYLKLISNPRDYVSFRRIVNVPIRGIGGVTRDKVINKAMEIDEKIAKQERKDSDRGMESGLMKVLKNASQLPRIGKKIQKSLNSFAKMLESLSEEKDKMHPSDFIDKVIKVTGYADMLLQGNDARKFEKVQNLDELVSDAREFEMSSSDKTLKAFLQKVALFTDIDNKKDYDEEDEGMVTLMTVHSAKGLEFPIVFIVGLEEGLFPHSRSIEAGSESAIEEERRLFYVALTRAIKKVYLTYARERTLHGRTHNQSPSRFLREVPEELIDHYMPEISHRSFTRKVAPVFTKPRKKTANKDRFDKNQKVYHKIFGKGIVEKSEKGYVTVRFEGMGIKTISQDHLNPYDGRAPVLKPGDKVRITGGPQGILKKEDNGFAYVILSNGDVEKVSKDKITLKKD